MLVPVFLYFLSNLKTILYVGKHGYREQSYQFTGKHGYRVQFYQFAHFHISFMHNSNPGLESQQQNIEYYFSAFQMWTVILKHTRGQHKKNFYFP